ncbi:MAG: cupin domain-containing protein [Burkholderiales bacterium]|nr:cupin domain-containing protein [Burkholderiales bacterium]
MQTSRRTAIRLLAAVLTASVTLPAMAEDNAAGMTTAVPSDKQWEKTKAMPYGMRIMLLEGDPAKPGPYVYRVKVPQGYKWPPLKYPDERVTTILKGTLWAGEGERYDPMKMQELGPGSTFVTKAEAPHFQWARTWVELQVTGRGPIDNPVTYVNPDDDPRNH